MKRIVLALFFALSFFALGEERRGGDAGPGGGTHEKIWESYFASPELVNYLLRRNGLVIKNEVLKPFVLFVAEKGIRKQSEEIKLFFRNHVFNNSDLLFKAIDKLRIKKEKYEDMTLGEISAIYLERLFVSVFKEETKDLNLRKPLTSIFSRMEVTIRNVNLLFFRHEYLFNYMQITALISSWQDPPSDSDFQIVRGLLEISSYKGHRTYPVVSRNILYGLIANAENIDDPAFFEMLKLTLNYPEVIVCSRESLEKIDTSLKHRLKKEIRNFNRKCNNHPKFQ